MAVNKVLSFITISIFCIPFTTQADPEFRELYRGARAQAMGNAFTAVADDESALFYNPAGLAAIEKSALHAVVLNIDASSDAVLNYRDTANVFTNFSISNINRLMGKDTYARAYFNPTYVMPNFAISYIYDQQIAIRAENPALPTVGFAYQVTQGAQFGFGFSFLKKHAKRSGDIRVGGAVKLMVRQGGYKDLPLQTLLTLNSDSLSTLTGAYYTGYGGDLGIQFIRYVGRRISLQTGAALTDIGDLTFGGTAQTQPMNLSTGVAFVYQAPQFKLTAAYDFRNMTRSDGDWNKKQHLGVEVAIPVFSFYGGFNQWNYTYGVAADFWLIRVTALSYAEELATFSSQDVERRYMLQIGLKFQF